MAAVPSTLAGTAARLLARRAAPAVARRVATGAAATACRAALQQNQRRTLTTTRASFAGKPVPLTAARDTSLQRASQYASLTDADIAHFRTILPGAGDVIYHKDDPQHDDLEPYNVDWMRKYRGQATLVLRPRTTEQVAQILKHCHARKLAVCPQGGNTGLVGGSVPVFDEVVVFLGNMHQVRKFDPISGIVVAEAGMILQQLDGYLADRGYMMPLDLGAKGTCQIGGNVATNAGGLRLLRYGSLHGSVLGLEVVLPDGRILNDMRALRKDNTGLDLKQLFIGSEGALGIITAVAILAPVRPTAVHVATLAMPNYQAVQDAFVRARRELGEILSAFEFWDSEADKLVHQHLALRRPLETESPFQVLIETAGSNAEHDMAKLEAFLENLMADEIAIDGAVAQDQAQVEAMWAVREGIPEACAKDGAVFKYDVSVPVPKLYELVEKTRERLEGVKGVNDIIGYGHVGDGNLHLNVSAQKDADGGGARAVSAALEPFIYELVASHNGSISAEHGVGIMKPKHLHYSKDAEMLNVMQDIKALLDPNGIMNPYKYLPPPSKSA
ncbi:hypothetical protein GGF31_007862 [Allomyces arbusculus]|nr:hypothetical protein GGF31_007862 [Allomyces arbusculus]